MKTYIWIELIPRWNYSRDRVVGVETGKTFKKRPKGVSVSAESRVVQVELNVPTGLFDNLVIGVEIPEPDLEASGKVDFS